MQTHKSAGLLWQRHMRSLTPALLLSDVYLVDSPLLSSISSFLTPIALPLC